MAREPSPASYSGKHRRLPDDADPGSSPKRRRHHLNRRHRHVQHDDESPLAGAHDEVEEGEILDDGGGAMDVDAEAQNDSAAPEAAPEPFGNCADMNSNIHATKLPASWLPSHSSSKDEQKSSHSAGESESGGMFSSDAEDTKGYEQSQRVSKSPQPRREKGRRHKDKHHTSSSRELKDHSRRSPSSRHRSEAHARDHSRSRETGAAANGLRAVLRDDSDRDGNDRIGKSNRHAARSRENERERSSSYVVHDGHGDRHDSQERYRDERRHSSHLLDRDNVDSREVTRRYRERSSSYRRSDRRDSAHHIRDECRDRERRSGNSRHKDHERRRDTSKDLYKGAERVGSVHEREKVRDDRDRGRHIDMENGTRRTREGKDIFNNSDRHLNRCTAEVHGSVVV